MYMWLIPMVICFCLRIGLDRTAAMGELLPFSKHNQGWPVSFVGVYFLGQKLTQK